MDPALPLPASTPAAGLPTSSLGPGLAPEAPALTAPAGSQVEDDTTMDPALPLPASTPAAGLPTHPSSVAWLDAPMDVDAATFLEPPVEELPSEDECYDLNSMDPPRGDSPPERDCFESDEDCIEEPDLQQALEDSDGEDYTLEDESDLEEDYLPTASTASGVASDDDDEIVSVADGVSTLTGAKRVSTMQAAPGADMASQWKQCKVRQTWMTRALKGFKVETFSSEEQDQLVQRAAVYAQSLKKLCDRTNKRMTVKGTEDVLNAQRGPGNVDRIKHDFGEIRACCATEKRRESFSESHPFKNLGNFLDQRFRWALGKRTEGEVGDSHMEALTNRSPDPEDETRAPADRLYRTVLVKGVRICMSCYRALLGHSRSTVAKLHHLALHGHHRAIDLRREKCVDAPLQEEVQKFLQEYVNSGNAEPIPNHCTNDCFLLEVPFSSLAVFAEYVSAELSRRLQNERVVSKHTVSRASKKIIYHHAPQGNKAYKVKFSFAAIKRFLKCTTCHTINNLRRQLSAEDRKKLVDTRRNHFRQVSAQRTFYHNLRDQAKSVRGVTFACAICSPCKSPHSFLGMMFLCPSLLVCRRLGGDKELMVLTIDGMDQAKTQVPHQLEWASGTESMTRLQVHVVAAFMYGGAQPITTFINTPEVKKDSCYTVTTIMRAISLQWETLMERAGGVLTSWPKRLHICFDNAVGENVNQNVFGFLGALVHHGVFLEITVSTLLVGHTHNICDQQFSVFSKFLNRHSCLTLSEMHRAFETCYKGRVKDASATEPADPASCEQTEAASLSATSEKSFYDSHVFPQKIAKDIHRQNKQAREDLAQAKPLVERLQQSVDASGWLSTSGVNQDCFFKIKDYHEFAIGKNSEKKTCLFRKYVVNAEVMYSKFPHNFEHNGVMYRKCDVMFEKDAAIGLDPLFVPYSRVPSDELSQLITKLETEKLFDRRPELLAEWSETIKQFKEQEQEQKDGCAECKECFDGLRAIGTLHKPEKSADQKTKEQYSQATTARAKLQGALREHLAEPESRATHKVADGWWTSWIKERIPKIQEYRRKEGILMEEVDRACPLPFTGHMLHPADHTPAEHDRFARVDARCMEHVGPPLKDHFIILRALREENKPPFWIAKVLRFFNPSEQETAYFEQLEAVRQFRLDSPHLKSDRQARFPDKPPSLDEAGPVATKPNAATKSLRKDALAPTAEAIFTYSHLVVTWFTHVEPDDDKTASGSAAAAPASTRPKRKVPPVNYKGKDDEGSGDEGPAPKVPRSNPPLNEDDIPLSEFAALHAPQSEPAAVSSSPDALMESQAQLEGEDSPAAVNASDPLAHRSLSDPIPAQALLKWRKLEYVASDEHDTRGSLVEVASAIWWGNKNTILTKQKQLTKDAWKLLTIDLGQDKGV